jgi:simple sugar transport system substrate-binding protein
VILTDRAVDVADDSLYVTLIGSDFVEEGRKAARWLVGEFEGTDTVNIVQLEGAPGAAPAMDRRRGFEEVIAQHPRFRIVRSEPGGFSREGGKAAMASILASGPPPIHAVFAHNDDMAFGAIEVLDDKGLKPGQAVRIVSVDAVHEAFEAMIAGKLNATVECNPLLGPQLMTSVTEVVAGRPIAKRIVVDEEAVFTAETARQIIQTRKY